MDPVLYKKDSALQLLSSLTGSEFVTVVYQGKNYKVQLNSLVQLVLGSQPAPEDTRRYFQLVPGYTVDDGLREISIDGTGKAYYDNSVRTIDSQTLVYADINTSGNQRFDAVLLDTENDEYTLLSGSEAIEAATPAYNSQRYLLLAYILIDENGSQVEEPPQTHPINKDQYLDQGGANQVSASALKALINRVANYIGYVPDEATLQTVSPTMDAFALVGSPIAIWVFDVETNEWSKPTGEAGTPSPTSGPSQLHYSLYSDLDTIGAEVSLQGKIVVDAVIRSSKIVGHSYMVKLDTSGTFTAQADIAALNAWIDAQVSQPTTIWQFYPVADFGSNQGAGSLTINYHV